MAFLPGIVSVLRSAYTLTYEISPIILVNGIAQLIPGNLMPIVLLTEAESATINLLNGKFTLGDFSDYFAHFEPSPGGMMFDNEVGAYPFLNQSVAANAIIMQPLQFSMIMKCPVKGAGGYAARLATMTILKLALDKHHQLGGYYDVLTPAVFYNGCILTKMTDVTPEDGAQKQIIWKLDFVQPLVTESQTTAAYNNLMKAISNGVKAI